MVRGIRPHIAGRVITSLRKCRCACKPISLEPNIGRMSRRARGRVVVDVRRLAKRVLLELDSGDCFVVEPRMTGLMLLADPPDRSHLRIRWDFADGNEYESLWFWDRRGLGTVSLYTADELQEHLGPHKLGPDALAMSPDDWHPRCRRTRRAIKVALLDQKLVAGIGNLYASEILHRARIHPQQPADRLTRPACRRLGQAVREILEEAIRYEGSTLGDGTYRNALNAAGGYQNEHRVYAHEGDVCPTCERSKIIRLVQAQRSTFFCPRCQRRR